MSNRKVLSASRMLSRRLFGTNHHHYNPKIDPNHLVVHKTAHPKPKMKLEDLIFGRSFSDHMLVIDWDVRNGWHHPVIQPYGDLAISPAASGLHYGLQCFEGMKAFKDSHGNIRMFRPDRNFERMNHSMTRLAMPPLDDGFYECLKRLLKMEESWIPNKEGYAIYIRPTAIGVSPFLGVNASEHVKLYAILSPVGPYYKNGFVPVKLFADTENVRAWPGGVGNAKVGGNYAPTIEPARSVAKHGCQQVLWLFGPQHEVTEVGAMNIFFLLRKPASQGGGVELVTAPLTRGDILPGVTRSSILDIVRGWCSAGPGGANPVAAHYPDLQVTERFLTMGEVCQADTEGRLLEVFGAGTAVVISPVKAILYNEREIKVPTGEQAGPMAGTVWKTLYDIQYGKIEHPWSVVI